MKQSLGNALFPTLLLLFTGLILSKQVRAQQGLEEILSKGEIHGNVQVDAQYYTEDTIIGAEEVPEDVRMNAFMNLTYTNGGLSAGLRYESYLNPILGFSPGYQGSGIPFRYATYTADRLSVTVGNYYEQFGSGMIFRSYEERGLGLDNAMDGVRVKYELHKGVHLKGIIGRQRIYYEYSDGILRGFDGEVSFNELFKGMNDSKTRIMVGGSFISKYEQTQSTELIIPENVGASAARFSLHHGNFGINGEYAYKINDPSLTNGNIYRHGEGLLLQTSYSKKGLGMTVSAKRTDNMFFSSDRNANAELFEGFVNYLPAVTKQHTYNLLSTLYPYATQPNGEMALQGDFIYTFKRGSAIGGKYGTTIAFNYSAINNIDTVQLNDDEDKRQGYTSDFFKFGKEKYFRDFNVEIAKKFNKKFKGIFTYAYLEFDKFVIQGKEGFIYAHVGIADLTYKIKPKHAIRTELQHMYTEDDLGDWATVLVEYTFAPHWFIAVQDQWNYGNEKASQQLHYYYTSVGYNNKGSRISLGYGRQRAGIFCVGGVCRNVPASNGIALSITSSF
jgi:hypothetical protein